MGGCAQSGDPSQTLTLATTTSTRDSGLLALLVPMFEKETGFEIKVVAVGTGQALELGRRGDADVLLTHAPIAEQGFIDEGYGELRRAVMHNDFVLVGPANDPAGIHGADSASAAFQDIAQTRSPFVSRGDASGTYMKEQQIWRQTASTPDGDWYVESGTGMAQALRVASETGAYTLADRGTFLAQRAGLQLEIVCEGDPLLRNPYTVIVISQARHPAARHLAASRFSDFLVSPKVQAIIGRFGIKRFGQPLFYPQPETDS
jgi:tungstate transport system substrate-binding protein